MPCYILLNMNETFKPNTKNFKVLTPNGFQPFAGISMRGIKPLIRLEFERNAWIECTFNHKLYAGPNTFKTAEQLEPGDTVECVGGSLKLLAKINLERSEPVYDLIEVENGHRYYTNDILSSNCEFLVYDETLINSIKLSEMEGAKPLMNVGQARWYKKPSSDCLYAVALDPSLGTGGNNAAIQILELPTFVQVAEWQHNLTPIQGQIRILREMIQYLAEQIGEENAGNIYWSIENNTVGEAGLVCIRDIGEENFPGLFLSEPVRKGHVRKFRKGFNTTHGAKISASARLKYLIESNKMKVNSKALISELKSFIASGVTFKAKGEEQDDLVAAMLLAVRMSQVLADWDPRVFESISTHDGMTIDGEEDYEMPMPIFISSSL